MMSACMTQVILAPQEMSALEIKGGPCAWPEESVYLCYRQWDVQRGTLVRAPQPPSVEWISTAFDRDCNVCMSHTHAN